jgi:lipopolysaccharide transport system ATP-binding protein
MKKREIDRKFDEIVDFSGVEKFIDTPVKRYSSGMTVRLGFAVAAHLEPEILLVDEVLAVGDAEFQKKCLGKMGEVATSGRTVLFVSHNMGAVRQLTGTSILLCDGHLLRVGPTSEVVDLYLATLCHENATVYDVEGSPRRFQGLSRDVEFISLELDSGPSKTFCSGAEIPFLARVRGNRNVERFRISLTIFRSDGIPVGSLFTPESLSLHDREVAVFRVELRDLRLAPGRYHIGLAVGRGTPETGIRDFDIVVDVLHYEVLPPFGSRGTRSSWLAGWGAIMFGHCSVTRLG